MGGRVQVFLLMVLSSETSAWILAVLPPSMLRSFQTTALSAGLYLALPRSVDTVTLAVDVGTGITTSIFVPSRSGEYSALMLCGRREGRGEGKETR